MKLIDVDEIKWEEGAFLDSETGRALPIIHKIATIEMLRDWQKPANAIAIPEHATNGDVIKALFPNSNFCGAVITHLNGETQYWRKDWWNAEYKEPSSSENPNKSEIPTSSTTKNDLGVDCISRQGTSDAIRRIHPIDTDYDCTLFDKVDVMYVLNNMPSVTPQEPRWIPCSERLPEERDWYLAVFKEIDTGYQLIPRVADYIGYGENEWRIIDEDGLGEEYRSILECVAWMPLPKAYREVTE